MTILYPQLTKDNHYLLAVKHYDNPACTSLDEFKEDFDRIKYIKKLLNRYIQTGDLKDRLILNHIIALINVFGPQFAASLLFFKFDPPYYPSIKTFLIQQYAIPTDGRLPFLNNIDLNTIPLDQRIIHRLRDIHERAS